jgi:hypothetical protein
MVVESLAVLPVEGVDVAADESLLPVSFQLLDLGSVGSLLGSSIARLSSDGKDHWRARGEASASEWRAY